MRIRFGKKKTITLISLALLVVIFGAIIFIFTRDVEAPEPKTTAPKTNSSTEVIPLPAIFNKKQFSLTDPKSIWIIVNKQHALNPVSYAPPDLRFPNVSLAYPGADNMHVRDATATALEQMFAAAAKDKLKLQLVSGYRSYNYQVSVYNGYVNSIGQTAADSESARPGYSEHQTGFAVDIQPEGGHCSLQTCFRDTPEGKWLADHAYEYGFILRYPADKTAITGYMYEPWHFRYVGTALAGEMHVQHIETLEEFFNVAGGTSY